MLPLASSRCEVHAHACRLRDGLFSHWIQRPLPFRVRLSLSHSHTPFSLSSSKLAGEGLQAVRAGHCFQPAHLAVYQPLIGQLLQRLQLARHCCLRSCLSLRREGPLLRYCQVHCPPLQTYVSQSEQSLGRNCGDQNRTSSLCPQRACHMRSSFVAAAPWHALLHDAACSNTYEKPTRQTWLLQFFQTGDFLL